LEKKNKKVNSFFSNNLNDPKLDALKKDIELLKNRVKLIEQELKKAKK
jgi:hypothetical protein